MGLRTGQGLVLAVRPFGERDALVELFCAEHGRLRGLVKGGKGTRNGVQAALQPMNTLGYEHFRRLDGQLGTLTVELAKSRVHVWMGGGAGAFVVPYLSELLAGLLPEEHPYEGLEERLLGLLASELAWQHLVAFELWLLDAVGYGLRLRQDDAVGVGELAYVSPASGRVVGRDMAVGYEGRLLRLPECMGGPQCGDVEDFRLAWRLTGCFLEKALHGKVMDSRERLAQAYERSLAKAEKLRENEREDIRHDIAEALAA